MSDQTTAEKSDTNSAPQTAAVPTPTKKRLLTVRFRVEDKEASQPLWDAFTKDGKEIFGMVPRAMGWGDEFANSRMWQQRYEYAKRLLKNSAAFDEIEKLERLERLFRKRGDDFYFEGTQ